MYFKLVKVKRSYYVNTTQDTTHALCKNQDQTTPSELLLIQYFRILKQDEDIITFSDIKLDIYYF